MAAGGNEVASNEPAENLRALLRRATRDDHIAIDAMMAGLDFSSRATYGRFLNVHHLALQRLAPHWAAEDCSDFVAMTRCVMDDMTELGVAYRVEQPRATAVLNVSNRQGIAYVIRGSRLGSAVLRTLVPTPFRASYLEYVPLISWPEYLRTLAVFSEDSSSCDGAEVVGGAKIAFEEFRRAATLILEEES